ncbi:MAG TPA: dihydroorotate dehydrogenase electron transfer subunit [bacterium]|nr:dihydroorotate dehydrogenase electron transfer subunit [bacterium]
MQRSIVTAIADMMPVADDCFLMAVPFEPEPLPGQFVMLSFGDGRTDPFLPRPISIFDWEGGMLTLLIRVVGRGTLLLGRQVAGATVRVTGPLGNSFPDDAGRVCFIGGGIGVAPLFYAAKRSKAKDRSFILGFRSADESYLTGEFSEVAPVRFVSDDGSLGEKLFPHEKLDALVTAGERPDLIVTCGPEKMMAAVHGVAKKHGLRDVHSLESRMGCGIGACLGCRVSMPGASVLVCKEGAVFDGSVFDGEKG